MKIYNNYLKHALKNQVIHVTDINNLTSLKFFNFVAVIVAVILFI